MTISGGNSCIDRTGVFNSSLIYTLIDTTNTISGDGFISSFCFYSDSGNSYYIKPKIFRLVGSNYEVVYSEPSWIAASGSGLTTLTGYSISVKTGDLVGIGLQPGTGNATIDQGTGGTFQSYFGDVTTTTTAPWSSSSYMLSLGCSGDALVDDYYVVASGGSDSNNGTSWNNSWATIDKGMSTVPSNKTLHIGFGSYTSEPANNTLSPDADDVTVIYETADTGGGSGTATIEVN